MAQVSREVERQESTALVDRFGRSKQKLRISITDRCNFRCGYCMPEDPEWLPREALLSYEELLRLAKLFVTELGIRRIRVTGGEPLLRKGVDRFVASLSALREAGLERISMTSNGVLLRRYAPALVAAGLDDVNVSIDAISPARFQALTKGDLQPVLAGIEAAQAAGLPVKLNAVVIRDHNEDEILPLVRWAYRQRVPLRFIEFMPLDGNGAWSPQKVVPEAEIIERLSPHFAIEQLPRTREPARYYRVNGDYRLGVISTVSNPFCESCDRVRLTATGEIFPCLFSPVGVDLKAPLRAGAGDAELVERIRAAVWQKGRGFAVSAGYVQRSVSMHSLGG
ncbi:GTP 3',8-cyclase MoaA [Alkalilimnicola ehrlichii]|uniref:GTP 3',8-cyclase n=1 Tax=Alkalilimnicola ehrlichii TaxID=351052 RepID=A0A3E0X254_9GAMM|nr:GTP 3',8-cyclase MoaA [Alkalilimnicola ehrlichii]RFA31148.1 GTP 3',8-cyclase MoaA [Alkalilimnicola ehrlichii]RFA39567.1 GTP 3',8-cyclase MoaA [Alkalilimnicola ehrlichii]